MQLVGASLRFNIHEEYRGHTEYRVSFSDKLVKEISGRVLLVTISF